MKWKAANVFPNYKMTGKSDWEITAVAEAEEVPQEPKATEMSEMGTLMENTDLETHKNYVWLNTSCWTMTILPLQTYYYYLV